MWYRWFAEIIMVISAGKAYKARRALELHRTIRPAQVRLHMHLMSELDRPRIRWQFELGMRRIKPSHLRGDGQLPVLGLQIPVTLRAARIRNFNRRTLVLNVATQTRRRERLLLLVRRTIVTRYTRLLLHLAPPQRRPCVARRAIALKNVVPLRQRTRVEHRSRVHRDRPEHPHEPHTRHRNRQNPAPSRNRTGQNRRHRPGRPRWPSRLERRHQHSEALLRWLGGSLALPEGITCRSS